MCRDYYNVALFQINLDNLEEPFELKSSYKESRKVESKEEWEVFPIIKFRQSPYLPEEFLVMNEKSRIFDIKIGNSQYTKYFQY